MRGFDYRAPQLGVTLVIAKSFAHEREAVQGLNRVGRFGEPCRRVRLSHVPLIDERASFNHRKTLNAILAV